MLRRDRNRARALLGATLLLAGAAAVGPAAAGVDDRLTSREIDALAEEYLGADRARQLEIEAELAPVDLLDERQVESWRKKLQKLCRKGPRLELSGTNHLYDEAEKSGKYIVSGKSGKALVLGLHGGGAGVGDAGSAAGQFGSVLGKARCLAIFPEVLRKTEHGWGEEDTERFVLDLIEHAKRTKEIDPDRIYLTGHSMGGYGTWTIGARHADVFAGLAAFAGAATPVFDIEERDRVVDIEPGVLPNLRNLPIFVYQSLDDPQVPPASNVFAAQALAGLQEQYGAFEFRYEEVDGRGHDFPEKGPGPGVEWAMEHVRNPVPARVLWQPSRSWKRMFYWLWWEEPELGRILDVEVAGENRVEIRSEGEAPQGFALFVDERLFRMEEEIVVHFNGEEVARARPEHRLSTLLRTALRNDAQLLFSARVDVPGPGA